MGFWNWFLGTGDAPQTMAPWRDAEGSVAGARTDIAAEFSRRGIGVHASVSDEDHISFKRADVQGSVESARREIRRREAAKREGFRDRVRELLRERFGGDRKAFYEAAGIDRRLFSKMISYAGYAPSKETAIAVALAARLTLDEARGLLHIAGYALSESLPADIVYAACFRRRVYERAHVRALLDEFAK